MPSRVHPRVEIVRPGLLTFATRGPSRYFGGDRALAEMVHAAVHAAVSAVAAAPVRVGVADGRFAAQLAARNARPEASGLPAALVVAPGGSASFVAPFPVVVLGAPATADLLERLGLPTVGDFAALPPGAVAERFGPEGHRLHCLARGLDDASLALTEPPPDLVEQIELDPPATRVDTAAFAAKALADRLLARLGERGLVCTRVMVEAETEHGERLARCWRHEGAFTAAALAERVRWQLDGWFAARSGDGDVAALGDPRARQDAAVIADAALTSAIGLLRIVPDEVLPADGRQLGFWGGDQVVHDRADRVLARVQGMLGHDAVVTAVPQGAARRGERAVGAMGRAAGAGAPALRRWGEARLARCGAAAVAGARLRAAAARRSPRLGRWARGRDGPRRGVGATGVPTSRRAPRRWGEVRGWAGPWPHDVRWWDPAGRRRRVLWQVVVDAGSRGEIACLISVEAGRAGVEALYD
ncbi:MAG: DNA polymerase Y family protein [Acidimicrobiia bacterium]|nr:DNA polymerase Y family protein [Acidimicrobiia bacterium]